MSKTSQDTLSRQTRLRTVVQLGGARCLNDLAYLGKMKDVFITGASRQKVPTFTPEFFHDACLPGEYIQDGGTREAPTPDTFTLNILESCEGASAILAYDTTSDVEDCDQVGINLYQLAGKCTSLCDLCTSDWSKITVFSNAVQNGPATLADDAATGDTTLTTTVPYNANIYYISKLRFSDLSADDILDLASEAVVDTIYYGGTKRQAYLLNVNGAASLWYTQDGGTNWNESTLDFAALTGVGLSANYYPRSVDVVGSFVMVTFLTDDALTPVNAGYVLLPILQTGFLDTPVAYTPLPAGLDVGPSDIFVADNGVFFSMYDNAVYFVDRITSGVATTSLSSGLITNANLNRIHGCGETLVAVGNEGVLPVQAAGIIYSKDGGLSWQVANNIPGWGSGVGEFGLVSVFVFSEKQWDVGTDGGQIFRTCDCGVTWTLMYTNPNTQPITDIISATDEVWYAITTDGDGNARLVYSVDGGVNWCSDVTGSRIKNWTNTPHNSQYAGLQFYGARLDHPHVNDMDTRANKLIVGGPSTTLGDGFAKNGTAIYGGTGS